MKRSTVSIVFFVSILLGTFAGRFIDITLPVVLVSALATLASSKKMLRIMFIFVGVGLLIGNLRALQQRKGLELLRTYFETKTTITVESLEDAEYNNRGQLAFSAKDIVLASGQSVPGQVSVSGFGEVSVLRGDVVEVSGKLLPARGSSQARISFADINTIERNTEFHNQFRRLITKRLRDALPEPLSSFAGGLLIGHRATIPDHIIDSLRDSGLAHIIAVSGYNLTIIIRIIMRPLSKLSRYQALIGAALIGFGFMLISGFSASMVRAGLVSILSLLAWYYGKTIRAGVLLSLVAAVTVLYRPEYIWGDVSWYLSFLAFSGVLILAPLLIARIYGHRKPKIIGRIILETVGVMVLVVPYSIYIFGTTSLYALVANVAVVPLVPFAMLFSTLAALGVGVVPYIAMPAQYVLATILEVARFIAELPFATVSVRTTPTETVVLYILILMMMWILHKKTKVRLTSDVLIK